MLEQTLPDIVQIPPREANWEELGYLAGVL
jgi:hypothetical protein